MEVFYAVEPDLSAASKEAISDAVADWNMWSAFTKVQLIEGSSSGLYFWKKNGANNDAGTAANPDSCMHYSGGFGDIYITKNMDENNTRDELAPMVRHEIGHFLGLDEAGYYPSPPSIMNNIFLNPGESCSDAMRNMEQRGYGTRWVEPDDAYQAADCLSQAWASRTFDYSYEDIEEKEIPDHMGGGYCYQYWYVVEEFVCASMGDYNSCSVTGSWAQPGWTNCPPGI